jgi:hypothetical protein
VEALVWILANLSVDVLWLLALVAVLLHLLHEERSHIFQFDLSEMFFNLVLAILAWLTKIYLLRLIHNIHPGQHGMQHRTTNNNRQKRIKQRHN